MVQVSIRLGLAASILMLGGAGALQAADMPVKAVPMMPASYNWTGIYAGVHAGYGRGMKDWLNSSFDYPVKGFLGGGQIGVNQQIGNWVIGIEADASWSNLKGDQTLVLGGPLVSFTQTATVGTTIDALATVVGRVGFAQDRWLVYLKAGAAWARETHNLAFTTTTTFPGAAPITSTSIASGSETRLGYVVGFGSGVRSLGQLVVQVRVQLYRHGRPQGSADRHSNGLWHHDAAHEHRGPSAVAPSCQIRRELSLRPRRSAGHRSGATGSRLQLDRCLGRRSGRLQFRPQALADL